MGECFCLYNFTKRESVGAHLPASKASEYFSHAGAAAVVLRYMLANRGDHIAFVSDWDCELNREFFGLRVSLHLLNTFVDKTEDVVAGMVADGTLEDHGFLWRDEHDSSLFIRDIRVRVSSPNA